MVEAGARRRHQMKDEGEINSRQERRGGQRENDVEVRDGIEMKGSGLQLIGRIWQRLSDTVLECPCC